LRFWAACAAPMLKVAELKTRQEITKGIESRPT